MKKKGMFCLLMLLFLVIITPVNAKESKVTCKYIDKKGNELVYKIGDKSVELPFNDGKNNWYHQDDFENIYLNQARENSINYVCPVIMIEETNLFTTVFSKGKKENECNGDCEKLVAIEAIPGKNISVKKAVDTTAISSVGLYNAEKYFVPYFRLLEDGTKEWSINGYNFIPVDNSFISNNSSISLDKILVNKVFKNNKLNDVKIYRNVKNTKNGYEYLLSIKENKAYTLKDGQELAANAYVGAYGANDDDKWIQNANQVQSCGDGGILGNVNDPNSVAWLLQKLLDYLKVLGPVIVVIMSSIEYANCIISSDEQALAKANKKLITRIILAGSLFLLPYLVGVFLNLFGITSNATCGLN